MAFFVARTDTNTGKTLFSMAFMFKYGIKNDFTYPASPYYAATLEKTKIDLKMVNQCLKENQDKKVLIEEIPEFFEREYLRDFITDNFNLSDDFIKNLK